MACVFVNVFTTLDGNPLPTTTPSDRQRLLQTTMKYKSAIEHADKNEKEMRTKTLEAKQTIQRQQGVVKQAQRAATTAATAYKKRKALSTLAFPSDGGRSKGKEVDDGERSAIRVKETIAALGRAATKRREQFNRTRSSTANAWTQTLPDIPLHLGRSLWYKMHRRRQQIVLRPPSETFVSELRDSVAKKLKENETAISTARRPSKTLSSAAAKAAATSDQTEGGSSSSSSPNDYEDELLRAEQLLLLAMHPVMPVGEKVPSIPTTSTWGEPGKNILNPTISLFPFYFFFYFLFDSWQLTTV